MQNSGKEEEIVYFSKITDEEMELLTKQKQTLDMENKLVVTSGEKEAGKGKIGVRGKKSYYGII